jgi:methanogenic corrinoid protein MtbC1
MVAALMGADGWGVTYLGADTPVGEAVALAEKLDATVLAFGVTMDAHVDALGAAGKPAKDARAERILGGRAATPALARAIGARTLGDDLTAAIATLRATAAAA